MKFDLAMTDELLATTRAVRKRLDLERPVPREVILECLELAVQAPTGSNSQTWRWVVIEDADKRAAIAQLYRTAFLAYNAQRQPGVDAQTERVIDSALWLAENFHKVPVFVIPCVEGRIGPEMPMAQIALHFGANDVQGTVMREAIFQAAGASAGTEQKIGELVRFVREAGRIPVQRDTLYNEVRRWPLRDVA